MCYIVESITGLYIDFSSPGSRPLSVSTCFHNSFHLFTLAGFMEFLLFIHHASHSLICHSGCFSKSHSEVWHSREGVEKSAIKWMNRKRYWQQQLNTCRRQQQQHLRSRKSKEQRERIFIQISLHKKIICYFRRHLLQYPNV